MKARENPFATHRTDRLAFRLPPGQSWPALLQRLEEMNYCGAIVGRHGSGKTILLEEMQEHLRERGFEPHIIRLSNESSMREKEALPNLLRRIEKPGFILLDGAEQLSTRHWLPVRSAAGRAAGFVVTVHRVSRLPTWLECTTSPQLLEELVDELTEMRLDPVDANDLMARHFGNVRDCLRELYDHWAEQHPEPKAEAA
jgi:hypothetical protein